MSAELWHAVLNPHGPNYHRLKDIFGEDRVPLQSCHPVKAQLGEEKDVPVYLLDFRALPLGRRARLFAMVARQSGVPVSEIECIAREEGFPIREADVVVSFDMRAMV